MTEYDIHAKQWEFLQLKKHNGQKPAYWACLLAGRRSGKTMATAKMIVKRALDGEMGDIGIGCGKKDKAMDLYCQPILDEFERFGVQPLLRHNKAKATYVLPTKHKTAIYFFSAGKKSEAEDIRGNDYKLFVWDETQSLNHDILKYASEEIIEPAFVGGGWGIAVGTAPRVLSGWYWDLIENEERHGRVYRSNMHDNFFYTKENIEIFEAGIKKKYKIVKEEDSPFFMREYRGVPMRDNDSCIFMYDPAINHYEEIDIPEEDREHVIGVDLGDGDDTAISITCFSKYDDKVYLVKEDLKTNNKNIDILVNKVKKYHSMYKVKHPIVVDTQGGASKMVAKLITARYGIPFEGAKKKDKAAHIQILASALHEGKVKIRDDTRCRTDMDQVEWDKQKKNFLKTKAFHTDILDALLYSFRFCQNYLKKSKVIPKEKTKEEKRIDSISGPFQENSDKKHENELYHKFFKHF